VAQCLAWHVRPKLAEAEDNGDRTIRARCPACGSPRAFTIGPGDQSRFMWNCWSCRDRPGIHRELIRAGVRPDCLPMARDILADIVATIAQIVQEPDSGTRARLRIHLILKGYRRWPKGRELVELAAEIGIGRTAAFDARQAGGLPPVLSLVPNPAGQALSRTPRSDGVSRRAKQSANADKSANADSRTVRERGQGKAQAKTVRERGQVPASRAAGPRRRA
jgi:hypothetical protein